MLRTAAVHRYYPPIINTKENQDADSIIKEIEKKDSRQPEHSYLFKYRDDIYKKK